MTPYLSRKESVSRWAFDIFSELLALFIWKIYLSCLLILVIDVFQAVNQLCSHFEAYRDVPKITELREKFKNIKQILKSHVFSDFSRYVILFDQKIKFIVTQVFIFGKITLYLVWNNVMFMPLIMSCGPNVLLWPSISLQCM